MQVTVEALSAHSKKLSFTIEHAKVDSALDRAYKTMGKDVRLPGFRPGHVPRALLEQRYGRQVEGEVGSQLIGEAFDAAIKEHGLELVSQPIVQRGTLRHGVDYAFSVTVEVKPEIVVTGWEGLDVEWERVEVTDEEVDKEIQALVERGGTMETAPDGHVAQARDLVTASLTLTSDGLKPHTTSGLNLLAGVPSRTDKTAAWLAEHAIGLAVGQNKEWDDTVPPGAVSQEWQGKAAHVVLHAATIKARRLPAIDDDFARDQGHDSLDLLRADLRFRREEQMREHVRQHASRYAVEKLIELNPVEVPPGLVRQEADNLLAQQRQFYAQRGVKTPKVRVDQLAEDVRERLLGEARFSVSRALLLQDVVRQAGLAVDDAEMDGKITEIASELGQQPAAVKGLLQKNDGFEDLRLRLLEEKALDLVLERANVIDIDPKDHEHETESPLGDAVDAASKAPMARDDHGHEHSHDHGDDHGHDHQH